MLPKRGIIIYSNDGRTRTEDHELPESAESISMPAGTYTGEFPWNETSINNLKLNEIIIGVSSNGVVSGSATRHNSITLIHREKCKTHREFWGSYTINGQIAGVYKEMVEVQKSSYEITDWIGCVDSSTGYQKVDDECSCEGLLTISDGELIIICGTGVECAVYLTANR